jgi:hypothetical protein
MPEAVADIPSPWMAKALARGSSYVIHDAGPARRHLKAL